MVWVCVLFLWIVKLYSHKPYGIVPCLTWVSLWYHTIPYRYQWEPQISHSDQGERNRAKQNPEPRQRRTTIGSEYLLLLDTPTNPLSNETTECRLTVRIHVLFVERKRRNDARAVNQFGIAMQNIRKAIGRRTRRIVTMLIKQINTRCTNKSLIGLSRRIN